MRHKAKGVACVTGLAMSVCVSACAVVKQERGPLAVDRSESTYVDCRATPNDTARRSEWFREAARRGLVGAECDYGSAYFYGAGVPADTAQQIAWYRKAAERGFAAAQYSLGYAVTVEDPAQAVWWFQKAAEQGYAPAERDLGEAYEIGRGGLRKDEARALELYRRAAARGDVRAQQHLAGKYLFGGAGVPKDPVRGWAWEVLAEFSGEPPTPEHFRSSRLTPEQQAEAEKLASDWYEQHREAMRNEQ